jgi:hypothetical protein
MAARKLDFLLDTIDTEVANLADTVVTEGPILYEAASNDQGSAIGFNHETTAMDIPDLDMGVSGDSDEPPSDLEPVDKETAAALDALRDAESEVEAMLTVAGMVTVTEDAAPGTSGQDVKEQPASKTLAELFAAREIATSKLAEKAEALEEAAADHAAADDKPLEDLFSDPATKSDSQEDARPASESSPPPYSVGDLATLMSNKIEGLLIRLVEERLPVIAERIIVEKLNNIIVSIK